MPSKSITLKCPYHYLVSRPPFWCPPEPAVFFSQWDFRGSWNFRLAALSRWHSPPASNSLEAYSLFNFSILREAVNSPPSLPPSLPSPSPSFAFSDNWGGWGGHCGVVTIEGKSIIESTLENDKSQVLVFGRHLTTQYPHPFQKQLLGFGVSFHCQIYCCTSNWSVCHNIECI